MGDPIENQKSVSQSDVKDHLANERTFLAWIRTGIGIMAFGFVVEKFAIFIKKIYLLLGQIQAGGPTDSSSALQGYSSIFGVLLVALGVLISLLAFIKYKQVESQIENGCYKPSSWLSVMLTMIVLFMGIFLMVYLNSPI